MIRAGFCVALLGTLAIITSAASAGEVPISEWGPEDTLGAVNRLTPAGVVRAAKLVKTGKTYPLGVVTGSKSPAVKPRTYQMTILQLDDGSGKPYGKNKLTGNDDLMNTFLGIGSQLDGLGHVGINHHYYNNIHAKDFVRVTGLTKLSTHEVPPIVTRGVLLDIAGLKGKKMMDRGEVITKADIDAAMKAQNVSIGEGDVVLFHTGWMNLSETDGEKFMSGEPGIGVEAAVYLAEKKIVAVGSDTFGVEASPFEEEGQFYPVHQELLTKRGIYLLENMDTRQLAADKAWEFMFVLGQPRFEGSVQTVINPVAIR